MTTINLVPYQIIARTDFPDDTLLRVRNEDFQNVAFKEGEITFTFSGCRFDEIQIENSDLINFKDISIQFLSCLVNEIEINTIESENISIYFTSSIVSGKINNDKIASVSFNNSIIRNSIFLENQKAVDISYTEENIFPIRWRRLIGTLNVEHITALLATKQSYYIYDSKKITFRTNEVKDKKCGYYRSPHQKTDDFKIGYYLNKAQKTAFNLNIKLVYSEKIEGSLTKILDSNFNFLSISGHLNGKLSIDNSKIENWFLREFSGEKEVSLYNISPLNLPTNQSKLEIHKCNLDNTWFDNVDFSQYKTVSFYRTKFGKAIFTSCNFPTDYISFEKFKTLENVHYPDQLPDNYYKSQYEIFLQLKLSLESTGNFYEAQKLQAISNDALKKIDGISSWDKRILWINSKSNNHGLSIKLPLIYFFLFSIFFYVLYLWSLGRMFNCNGIDQKLFGYYFSFIDLTHTTDFLVKKEELKGWVLTLDFLNKIVEGFFIYQFISSFRKYGKK